MGWTLIKLNYSDKLSSQDFKILENLGVPDFIKDSTEFETNNIMGSFAKIEENFEASAKMLLKKFVEIRHQNTISRWLGTLSTSLYTTQSEKNTFCDALREPLLRLALEGDKAAIASLNPAPPIIKKLAGRDLRVALRNKEISLNEFYEGLVESKAPSPDENISSCSL